MCAKQGNHQQLPIPGLDTSDIAFSNKFLERLVGKKLLHNPQIAMIELIANSWDAGATEVEIMWNSGDNNIVSISDNGEGMTKDDFLHRWKTLAYDRIEEQGEEVTIPGNVELPPRKTYGRNGIGRFAAFCFNDTYLVITKRNNEMTRFQVLKAEESGKPFEIREISKNSCSEHGTIISFENTKHTKLSESSIITEIALRFLGDPNFKISINSKNVLFDNIPRDNVESFSKMIDGLGKCDIHIIDTAKSDRTTKMHGIAIRVNGRLVGDIDWRHKGLESFIDGRRLEGKRLLVIVIANGLAKTNAIQEDWSGFNEKDNDYEKVINYVNDTIDEYLDRFLQDQIEKTKSDAEKASKPFLDKLTTSKRKMWNNFIEQTQKNCRSIKSNDVVKLGELVAKMEAASSRYSIISQLADCTPGDIDKLHGILEKWTVETAAVVLDEIETRMKVLEEMKVKTSDDCTDEVQELQPLFENGLWIFGAAYESILYTSNRSMNTVIHTIEKESTTVGSSNRPDFVLIPKEGISVGCYSSPKFDDYQSEALPIGYEKVVIVELKKPGVGIGEKEEKQVRKYCRELKKKCDLRDVKIECFVLGKFKTESCEPTVNGESFVIRFISYEEIISRASGRLLWLDKKIRNAPFIKEIESQSQFTEKQGELSID